MLFGVANPWNALLDMIFSYLHLELQDFLQRVAATEVLQSWEQLLYLSQQVLLLAGVIPLPAQVNKLDILN